MTNVILSLLKQTIRWFLWSITTVDSLIWSSALLRMRRLRNLVSSNSGSAEAFCIHGQLLMGSNIAATWSIKPARILTGDFETSLNAPGFSISLCNLSAASRESDTAVAELLELFDAPTAAVSWPNLTSPKAQSQPAKKLPEERNAGTKYNGADISRE